MVNNGGGNPNHDAEGKFTSAGDKAAPKAQPSPLEKLMGGLFKGAEKDLEEENKNIEAIKKMGFAGEEDDKYKELKDKLINIMGDDKELEITGDDDDTQVIIEKLPDGNYRYWASSGNHINGDDPDYTYESPSLNINELMEELDREGYDSYLKDFPDLTENKIKNVMGVDDEHEKIKGSSYYGNNFSGLEDDGEFDNFDQAYEWAWRKLQGGTPVKIGNVRIHPDNIDWESDGADEQLKDILKKGLK